MAIIIENIESARLREGIDDVGLRDGVARLQAKDRVKLSMSADGKLFETVSVRITSRRGTTFRGKLVSRPRTSGMKAVASSTVLTFSADQIHSIQACKGSAAPAPSERFSKPKADADESISVSHFVRGAPAAPATKARRTARGRLRVEVDAARRFIRVPIGMSCELHDFLRSRRIRSSPPQPYFSDCDCIELDRSIDVPVVQALLDAWRPVRASADRAPVGRPPESRPSKSIRIAKV